MDNSLIEQSKKELLLTVSENMQITYFTSNKNFDSSPPVINEKISPCIVTSNHLVNNQINPPTGFTSINEPSINSIPLLSEIENSDTNSVCITDSALLIQESPARKCCDHMRLKLELELDCCRACICLSCVFMGIVGLILLILAALKFADNDNNNNNNYSSRYYDNHWLFIYGGYDQDFIQKRRFSTSNESANMISCCFGCVYPHKYRIICNDCKGTLKEGSNNGDFRSAVCFGIFGIVLGIFGICFLIKM